tara:strand:- start:98 stop:655 length:558 start_codon:yes stop_codon:yes gene_type:complete
VLAFCDGYRLRDVLASFGADPAWVFVWDCVSSWWTPNRPLRRAKLCIWYGDLAHYNQEGAFYTPSNPRGPRTVSNPRGSYDYEPHPEGRRLSDLFALPITRFHAESEHSHAKPEEWVRCLVGNTSAGSIADPFAGSGTSLEVACNLDRPWVGCEISPAYCDTIRQRWYRWCVKNEVDPGPDALEG